MNIVILYKKSLFMIKKKSILELFLNKEHADLFIETIYSKLKLVIQKENINVSCAYHQDDKEGNQVNTIWECRTKEDREKIIKILEKQNLSLLLKSLNPKVTEFSLNKVNNLSKTAKISFNALKE